MSLPRFLDRLLDAAAPVLGGLEREVVHQRLEGMSVTLRTGERATAGPSRAGFLLACNLCARLYPRIRLAGPSEPVDEAMASMRLINPQVDVAEESDEESTFAALAYERADQTADVLVAAAGWNVYLDDVPSDRASAELPASLVAAALGVSELFRTLFADDLGARGRRQRQPGAFNLVTLGEPRHDLPSLPERLSLGDFRLVGAGAIGQAAVLTLAEADVRGTIIAIDHERIALSNLQRYVMTHDDDVDATKVELLQKRLAGSGLDVVAIPERWDVSLVEAALPTLVALDSGEDRIAVQASLPGSIYNAWTQPADVGWSRHEAFGDDPCLACLYWPDRERPSRHEQIAAAFHQHPLRVLAYLVHRAIPVGLPLPAGAIPEMPGVEPPADGEQWTQVSLLHDIASVAGVDVSELASWGDRPLADLYQEGICGGALLHLDVGAVPREVVVPLPHQSALAGIMLATQFLVAQSAELRSMRAAPTEARFDVLSGLPQTLPRPRTRTSRCLCEDSVFLSVYRARAQQTV